MSAALTNEAAPRFASLPLIGVMLVAILTGVIAQTWSFVPALLTAAVIAFIGALAYLVLVNKPIPEHEPGEANVPLPA